MAKATNADGLIFEALERALADPTPKKLHGTKANPGIFLSSAAAAKDAAQRCLEMQWIEPLGEQKSRGKPTPLYGISPRGIAYLVQRAAVPQLLAATRDGVAELVRQLADWSRSAEQVRQQLGTLSEIVQQAAARAEPPDVEAMLVRVHQARQPAAAPPAAAAADSTDATILTEELLAFLQEKKHLAPLQPVELPQLYRVAKVRRPALTLGAFHDWLRQMRDAGRVRLSPYTQAMYRLSEPECAMILGSEVIYYVERA